MMFGVKTKIVDGKKYYNVFGGWFSEDRVSITDDNYLIVCLSPEIEIVINQDDSEVVA